MKTAEHLSSAAFLVISLPSCEAWPLSRASGQTLLAVIGIADAVPLILEPGRPQHPTVLLALVFVRPPGRLRVAGVADAL